MTSKVLHNLQSDVFRNYFLNKIHLEKVIDFSAVSEHLFTKSKGAQNTTGPCSFIVHNWSDSSRSKNLIKHYAPKLNRLFRIFKILTIQKLDYKKISQQDLIINDWAWKVYLYGNNLDFKFIKHLKSNYKSIKEVTSNKRFVQGRGMQPNGESDPDTKHLQNIELIDSSKDLSRYHVSINPNTVWWIGKGKNKKIWDRATAFRSTKKLYEQGLFDGNTLLITKGLTSNYFAVAAYCDKRAIFRDAISGIKAKFSDDIILLKTLTGLLNSIFFSYFIFGIGSSTGIERKQVHNIEKFSLPSANNDLIATFTDEISTVKSQLKKLNNQKDKIFSEKIDLDLQKRQLEHKIGILEEKIEKEIHKIFNFTEEEKALINYSQEISIPLFRGESKPFEKVNKTHLKTYAKVFQDYFSQVFNRPNKYFQVEILESPFMIGLRFKIVKNKPKKWLIHKKDKKQELILGLLSTIAFEQITDRVFIQKDVKIVNKDSFCIIKPNEYKCWHEAVAYLDLDEFIPALLR